MDISKAILAKSDQLNAVDILDEVTVTITDVLPGEDDTKARIVTSTFGPARPYVPPKTVLREIGKVWGRDTKEWIGRQMSVYNLASVKYGGETVGGVRVSGLSHISKPIAYLAPQSDGLAKGAKLTIRPIAPSAAERDWAAELKLAGNDVDAVVSLGKAARAAGASEATINSILDRHSELKQ